MCDQNKNKKFNSLNLGKTGYSYLGTPLPSCNSSVSTGYQGIHIRVGISPTLGKLNFLFLFPSHVVNRMREAFVWGILARKNYFNDIREMPQQF